jgi:predicted helicase
MACGTGKTFTTLKIAERIAEKAVGGSARILFLVPSISLLSQSLREWTAQSELDLRVFAVCSDTKVAKLRNAEDFNVYDVPIPVTTNPAKLLAEMSHRKRAKGLTVVFSTYQSLPTVADAQALVRDARGPTAVARNPPSPWKRSEGVRVGGRVAVRRPC